MIRSIDVLIQIDPFGAVLLKAVTIQEVGGQKRWYYMGAGDEIPVILVAKGLEIALGQVWDASSGNEVGFKGFCRPAHEGNKIGKLTLHALVGPKLLSENPQVFTLSYQIRFFVEKFGNTQLFNRRWLR